VSLTATGAAFARAYHATHDDSKVFDDFLAAALFAPDEMAEMERLSAMAAPMLDPAAAGLAPAEALSRTMRSPGTSNLLSRGRYTEDRLADEIGRGVAQYVVLGAGLDTFAFRRRDLLDRLHMFEVDRPQTQADKQRRIARAGWQVPAQLRFVALDLMKGDLAAALAGAGFDPALRTFWSWMGVTHYLTRDAVLGTLRTLAGLGAPGSMVVFDHVDLDALDDAKATRAIVASFGEVIGFGFDPGALAAELDSVGLSLVEQLAPADIQARYFAGRSDGYRALEHTHFAAATTR
jgi:methyltransferase (TIGR00027 family)